MATRRNDEYWNTRAIDRTKAIDAHLDAQLPQLARIYDDAYRRIQADIEKIYDTYAAKVQTDPQILKQLLSKGETERVLKQLEGIPASSYVKPNYIYRISRLEAMKLELYAHAKQTYGQEVRLATDTHATTIKKSYLTTAYDIESGAQINTGFVGFNKRRLDQMLRGSWQGKNYSDRVWSNTDALAVDIAERIPAGLMAGHSMQRLSREVRERFEVKKYEADRLIRTETTYFENQAQLAFMEDIGLDEYVYSATLDSRTSEVCKELDGKRFKRAEAVAGLNFPPMHPNCRSATRAYLGAEFEPTQRRIRNEERTNADQAPSKVVNYTTYRQWAASLPSAVKTEAAIPTAPKPSADPLADAGQRLLDETRGEPMDIRDATNDTNPNYYATNDVGYRVNCQRCVPVYELRRRGFALEALPRIKGGNQIIQGFNKDIKAIFKADKFDFEQAELVILPSGRAKWKLKHPTHVLKYINAQPEGARMQVSWNWVRRRSGHTIMVERVPKSDAYPNGLAVIDPQTASRQPIFNTKGKTHISVLRVDDKEVDLKLVTDIAKKGVRTRENKE